MGAKSDIEWTDATWNPLRGCTRVSEGCRNCYAERVAARFSGSGQPYEGLAEHTPSGPRWTGEVRLVEKHLKDPLRWAKPRRVFVASMSDPFHPEVSDGDLDRIFAVMACATQHTFQLLTKRPERAREYLSAGPVELFGRLNDAALRDGIVPEGYAVFPTQRHGMVWGPGWPLPNLWLGVSAEDQATADERIPELLSTPAAVRFVSAEPLLGPIDPVPFAGGTAGIDWLIAGGESGPGARRMDTAWAIDLQDQCEASGVAFFFKQWGGVNKKAAGRELNGRTYSEFPAARAGASESEGVER